MPDLIRTPRPSRRPVPMPAPGRAIGLASGLGRVGLAVAALLCLASSGLSQSLDTRGRLELTPALKAAGVTEADLSGPHDPPVDRLHPDGQVEPALGGRLITHVSSEPPNLNFAIENSASIRHVHYDVHASLIQFSPVTWEYELDVAAAYDVEDTLILKGGAGDGHTNIAFGRLVDETADAYVLESGSRYNKLERKTIPKSDVEALEMGTVWTFTLRDDVLWQDGHPLDAQDLVFSWELFANPHVDCDEKRWKFEKIKRVEVLQPGVVRFFWEEQYFATKGAFGLDFCILPSHLYNLLDPEHPEHNASASLDERAVAINDNPHNLDWIGLGPYKVSGWERNQYLDADKVDTYWKKSPAESGYLDSIRWRFIKDDDSAWQALLNDELDIFNRVKSEDFVGEATRSETFTDRAYKALSYVGNIGYTSWNLHRKKFDDVRVRKALAHAFDVAGWIETNYQGFALWSMGTEFYFGPAYPHEIEPLEYDVEAAEDLLGEAGWYDRDGNGIVDFDGEDLVIQVLMPTGNKASQKFLQALQDAYRKIGVGVDIQTYEWATLLEKVLDRDFDAVNMAWTLPTPESDPMQIWHSDEAEFSKRSSNHAGLIDDEVDRLIELGRRELDDDKRHAIWRELHARIYSLQPYLFGWNVPRKIAINKRVHGFKLHKFEPGYRMRDLYLEAGTPGTRPLNPDH